MGYLGFGMRKEVYKRKPKKAFAKVKKHIAKNPYKTPDKKPEREVYIHRYHKPAYKRWWFILLMLGAVTFILYTYKERYINAPARYQQKVNDFEKTGFRTYYEDHKSAIDSLVTFLSGRKERITKISVNGSKIPVTIHLRSLDYERIRSGRPTGVRHERSMILRDEMEDEIVDGALVFQRSGIKQAFDDYWTYDLLVRSIGDINYSFINYMETTPAELNTALLTIVKNFESVHRIENAYVFRLRKFNEYYNVLVFDQEMNFKGSNKLTQLDDRVYWSLYGSWN